MSTSQPLKHEVARNLVWACYVLLLLTMIITSLPGQVPEKANIVLILVVKLLPLLIILPGLIQDQLRSFIWLCFIVLFYFTQSVVESFLSKGAGIDLIITLLTVVIFLSAMYYIKWERSYGRTL